MAEHDVAPDGALSAMDYDDAVGADDTDDTGDTAPQRQSMSPVRLAAIVLTAMIVALGSLAGWAGYRGYQSHRVQRESDSFLQVARQGALNLTTIDWQHADGDIQRILESATGMFYDDFSSRSKPFIEVVKKAQSKSVGTITAAGLESQSADDAQALVAVSVKSSNMAEPEQEPRNWRMRISVQRLGDEIKVSNVAFVP